MLPSALPAAEYHSMPIGPVHVDFFDSQERTTFDDAIDTNVHPEHAYKYQSV